MASEKRLIDANALEFEPDENCIANGVLIWGSRSGGKTMTTVLSALKTMIDNAPTVDAVEVVHGRWEKAHIAGYLKCNCCKDAFIYEEWLESGKWNYCPTCGAKMDGGNEDV
jgi:hypothetical protein